MQVKVQDLQPGMMVVYTQGKGILTVTNVTPWDKELYPQQYDVTFHGIAHVERFSQDTELEVLNYKEFAGE